MKQPIKKKEFKRPDIRSIKESLGFNSVKSNKVITNADKPQEFIPMPNAFVEATKLPGIPMGVTTIIHGHSNTGKSLLKNCLIASAQRQGILPVIFETENNFSFKFAIDCGMMATPVYGDVEVEDIDPETGEITTHMENRIIDYEGDFLYYDSEAIAAACGNMDYAQGKEVSKTRSIPVIEDIARMMNMILDRQESGDIQQPLLFIWDSIGSIPSFRSLTSKANNPMWDAYALKNSFEIILNQRIPLSKKVTNPYTNTFVAVNKVWVDSMSAPMAAPSIELKGGKGILYASRLTILLGGVVKAATKALKAVSKGETYTYGIETKIKVIKNQLDAPYNITYEGKFTCVNNGMISESELDEYKKKSIPQILGQLKAQIKDKGKKVDEITESDVQFIEEETDE